MHFMRKFYETTWCDRVRRSHAGSQHFLRMVQTELGNLENPTTIITVETAKHVVTPSMAEASRGMVFRQAPAFTLKATDGAEYSLGELIREGPLLLTFIKIGCPCSEAAQPFFNRLRAAYPHARILGVIDGDLGPANLWAKKINGQKRG